MLSDACVRLKIKSACTLEGECGTELHVWFGFSSVPAVTDLIVEQQQSVCSISNGRYGRLIGIHV